VVNKKVLKIEEVYKITKELENSYVLIAAHEEKEYFNFRLIKSMDKKLYYCPLTDDYKVIRNKEVFDTLGIEIALEKYNE
jgi:hypothetical protein